MRIAPVILLACCLVYYTNTEAQGGGGAAAASGAAAKTTPTPARFDFYPGSAGSFNLPYDSAFTLGIHYKKGLKMYAATLVQVKRNETAAEALADKSRQKQLVSRAETDTTDPVLDVEFRYNGKAGSGILKPARRYALLLTQGLVSGIYNTSDDKGVLTDFYNCFVNGAIDSVNCRKAITNYNKINTSLKSSTGISLQTFDVAFNYYTDKIYLIHKQYFSSLNSVNKNEDIQDILSFADLSSTADCINRLYKIFEEKNCACKPAGGTVCCDSICHVLSTLEALAFIGADNTQGTFGRFLGGTLSLQDTLKSSIDIKPASLQAGQQNNIALSLRQLVELRNALFRYGLDTEANQCLDVFLGKAQSALSKKNNSLSQLNALKQKIYGLVTGSVPGSRVLFAGIEIEDLNSYVFNFQTRTSLHITPVFGYATYKFGSTYDFSPYLGFQVNFEPMNQNVPFNQIRDKTPWQRLCFVTAWTLKSVSYPGKRQDFFGNSSSLLTGLGFKLSHVVMFNISALWFKGLDPNPYSTQKNIVCVPSLSLSLNLSVKDLLNGFTSLIPSL